MSDKYKFKGPINEEPDGTYITVAQMQFYLNRDDGEENYKNANPDFIDYYNICRVYNRVSDLMEEDPDSAIMYWDNKKEVVSMAFPAGGTVSKTLSGIEAHPLLFEEEDDEDDFFKD